ncbi:MAG TPA: hypothetical protein VFB38_11365 [Chthonomonadaceae bacterium]|nr:hypothetical protein [Chthonomonadaceae bacterium]
MFTLPNLFSRLKGARPQSDLIAPTGEYTAAAVLPPEEPDLLASSLRERADRDAPMPAMPCDGTIAQWRETVRATPSLARSLLRQGLALYDYGQYDEAALDLGKAARIGREAGLSSAECGLAYCALGCALLAQTPDSLEAALPAFQQTLRFLSQTQDFAPESLLLGLALLQQNRCEEAMAALKETLALGPEGGLFGTDPALAHCALGCALAAQEPGNPETARQEFLESFRLLCQNGTLRSA